MADGTGCGGALVVGRPVTESIMPNHGIFAHGTTRMRYFGAPEIRRLSLRAPLHRRLTACIPVIRPW